MSTKKLAKHARSASASGKSSHELWLNVVKSRSGGKPMTSTFTGLKQPSNEMSYMSTSHYMRQMLGTEKHKVNGSTDMTGKPMKGTPAYKSQEDYYDEILDLRKQVASVGNENTTLKARIRRLEEDNGKKEKEIDQLLNPGRSDDIRRTMTDRKADTGAVIHGLKQKILKLETQVKDKESSLSKIQADLKTTKVDEMRLQTEAYYQEMVRLRNTNDRPDSRKQTSKENPSKVKALNDTILRMNEKNVRLTSENRTLKEDLEKMMDEISQQKDKQTHYNDLNKKQLVDTIAKLEKKIAKKDADSTSMVSADGHINTKDKMKLDGSMAERLEQLDQRETDLMEENEKQRNIIKRLKEDREHYRTKCDDKSKETKSMKKEIEILEAELNSFYEKDKHGTPRSDRHVSPRLARPPSGERQTTPRSARPSSARSNQPRLTRRLSSESLASQSSEKDRQRKMKNFLENRAAKNIQKNWKSHKQRQGEDEDRVNRQTLVSDFQETHAAKTIQKEWRHYHTRQEDNARNEKVIKFKQNRAAKKIQHGWLEYQHNKIDREIDDAATLIQSAWSGHRTRTHEMSRMRRRRDPEEDVTEDDSGVEYAAETIQSAYRGHVTRKQNIANNRSPRDRSRSYDRRVTNGLDSEGGSEEIEEDLPASRRSTPPSSRHASLKRRDSAASNSSRTGRNNKRESPRSRTPIPVDSEDDDDDICF